MHRSILAASVALACGLPSAASAQVVYSPGYSTYYGPSYAGTPYYSNYSYASGYRPLGFLNPANWFGGGASTAYYSPFYSGAYTTAYAPSYTSYYSPVVTTPTTAYYTPTTAYYGTTVASNYVAQADACCPTAAAPATTCCPATCCPTSPCASCCAATGCPGGNCGVNYTPGDVTPTPDPGVSGGRRTYSNESGGSPTPADESRWNPGSGSEPYERDRDTDPMTRESLSPTRPIEQRRTDPAIDRPAPTDLPEDAERRSGESRERRPEPADGTAVDPDGYGEPDGSEPFQAPKPQPDARALDLDTRVTAAPSFLRERTPLRARFGTPQLARARVAPAGDEKPADVRLVRK